MNINSIKTEALDENYDLEINCNGFDIYISDYELKKKIIELIESHNVKDKTAIIE